MAWVYPQTVVNNNAWNDFPSGVGILPALMLGDDEYIWVPAATTNELVLDMGQLCTECHIRAKRGSGTIPNGGVLITFSDDGLPQNTDVYFINLIDTPDWQDFYYTPPFPWRYIRLEGSAFEVILGVSVLRAEGVKSITRRLLAGVGV